MQITEAKITRTRGGTGGIFKKKGVTEPHIFELREKSHLMPKKQAEKEKICSVCKPPHTRKTHRQPVGGSSLPRSEHLAYYTLLNFCRGKPRAFNGRSCCCSGEFAGRRGSQGSQETANGRSSPPNKHHPPRQQLSPHALNCMQKSSFERAKDPLVFLLSGVLGGPTVSANS